MKLFGLLLLVGLAYAAPASNNADDKVVVTERLFPDVLAIYTSQHDIVNIFVPLNALNFEEDESDDNDSGTTLFFVEADINGEETQYKGLYVLKNGNASKLLDEGRDFAAANDESKTVYFGAKDGIYVYNAEENKAEKYGSLTDSIINIAQENGTDVIYILTEDKDLYRVTDEGRRKVKVDGVKAEQIVLDISNNLYFYNAEKEVYVVSDDGIKKIDGLSENPSKLTLLRPPFVIEDGVPLIVDSKSYTIYANGSSELTDFEFAVKPTAYSMEATLIQYYAYNKKIYEYNILALILGNILEELSNYLDSNKDSIQSIATRSRSDLRAK